MNKIPKSVMEMPVGQRTAKVVKMRDFPYLEGVYIVCDNGGEFQQIRYWDIQSSSFIKDIR